MENQSHKEVDENLPLLENAKRSNPVAPLAMKERPRVDAKSFKAPAPPLRERNCKREDWKRGTPPNPVKVPPKSPLTYTERYVPHCFLQFSTLRIMHRWYPIVDMEFSNTHERGNFSLALFLIYSNPHCDSDAVEEYVSIKYFHITTFSC